MVLGVVLVAGSAQIVYRPYKRARFNRMERVSLATTALILYLCVFFCVDSLSSTTQQV